MASIHSVDVVSPEQAVWSFKFIEYLRSGDVKECMRMLDAADDAVHALHLAVQIAPLHVIQQIVSHPKIVLNGVDVHGSTPLHVSAKAGRLEVVKVLLAQDGIHFAAVDNDGCMADEVAKTTEIAELIKNAREVYSEKMTQKVIHMALAGELAALQSLYQSDPRVHSCVDINYQDPLSGHTLLHGAAASNNLAIVHWALENGADVFVRDRKNRLAQDLTKSSSIKAAIKEAAAAMTIHTEPGQAPKLQGVLQKWTNLASGYKARWFVLENGILSYYKNRDDAANACRGSINVGTAKLWIDAKDKARFDLVGKGSIRYHLKANHPAEAKRWIVALTQSKQWALEQEKRSGVASTVVMQDPLLKTITEKADKKKYRKSAVPVTALQPPLHSEERRRSFQIKDTEISSSASFGRSLKAASIYSNSGIQTPANVPSRSPNQTPRIPSDSDDEYKDEPPHGEDLTITFATARAQLDIQSSLLRSLQNMLENAEEGTRWEQMKMLADSFEKSVDSLRQMVASSQNMTEEREKWWRQRVSDEQERQRLWEDSLKRMALEHQEMQETLKKEGIVPDEEERMSLEEERGFEIEEDEDEFFDAEDVGEYSAQLSKRSMTLARVATCKNEEILARRAEEMVEVEQEIHAEVVRKQSIVLDKMDIVEPDAFMKTSYIGYPLSEDGFRKALPSRDENKPNVSFWSVLKNSIGKDLTKIALPVFFNEPTSMLQRLCEDMEYSELLDKAARQKGSTERMLFVAAFAMSNYSSTDGRVAKPFNPLLGETYEYVRPDKSFRYLSEQPISACYCDSPNYNVFAEASVKSKFWGKSFELHPEGQSHVELKIPVANTMDWTDSISQYRLPDIPGQEHRVLEHYSWTKVTTSVQNIIVGRIYIDHYGDMVIKNHRTGDQCVLTFKLRGWGGRNAYALDGFVRNADGVPVWELAGRWNELLVAKRATSDRLTDGLVDLPTHDDAAHDESLDSSSQHHSKRALLLWRVNPPPPPPRAFNFTTFAASLNQISDELKTVLPPTDSRLRPDQRAMEDGEWDMAASEKVRLEEKQRAKRREREAIEGYVYKPRWFLQDVDRDTGESFWKFDASYWNNRESTSNGGKWSDVENIF